MLFMIIHSYNQIQPNNYYEYDETTKIQLTEVG